MNIRIEKTVALVVALAKLHNFCINAKDKDIAARTANDKWASIINDAVPLDLIEGHNREGSELLLSDVVPEQLLHGNEHFDDIGYAGRHR